MAEATTKAYHKRLFHAFMMILIIIIFSFLPPIGEISDFGMFILGVFLATIYGWMFLDLLIASVISVLALCMSGAMTTDEIFALGLGNQVLAISIVFVFITAAINQMNLSDFIITWLMGIKISKGRPWIKFTLFIFAMLFVSILTSSNIACVMAVPLFLSLMKESGIQLKSKTCLALFGGVACAVFLGDAALPFKTAPLMYFGVLTSAHIDFDPGQYTFAFPFILFLLIGYVLICRFIFRIDISELATLDQKADSKATLDKRQKIVLVSMIILVIALVLPSIIPQSFGVVYTIINRLGITGLSYVFLALMILFQVDGKPLFNIFELAKDFQWAVIFVTIDFMALSNFMTSDEVGIKATIANSIGPLVEDLPPILLVMTIVLISVVATNFLNNMVVFLVVISALTIMGNTLPINILATSYLVGVASCLCYVRPSGNMWMAYLFSFKEIINTKKWIAMNFVSVVILTVLTATVGYWYYNLVF